jgi:hypothetical protein
MVAGPMCNNVAEAAVCELIRALVVPSPRAYEPPESLA